MWVTEGVRELRRSAVPVKQENAEKVIFELETNSIETKNALDCFLSYHSGTNSSVLLKRNKVCEKLTPQLEFELKTSRLPGRRFTNGVIRI